MRELSVSERHTISAGICDCARQMGEVFPYFFLAAGILAIAPFSLNTPFRQIAFFVTEGILLGAGIISLGVEIELFFQEKTDLSSF